MEVSFRCCDTYIRKMIMTFLIRLIAKVYKWLTFFKEEKPFGKVSPVSEYCHRGSLINMYQIAKK